MIKIAGFIAVICSTTVIGLMFSDNVSTHYKQLKSIVRMLEEIKIRLEYHLPTKEELFDFIFDKNEYIIYKPCNLDKTRLSDNQKQLLTEFYNQLGTTDLQGQLSNIEIYKKDFQQELSELSGIKDNRCRLFRTGGVLTGVFICLLLI